MSVRSLQRRSFFQGQAGLVLVVVLQGDENHHEHVEQHQAGEEEEVVGLDRRIRFC